jgi:hypothetical protein
LKIVV